MNDEVKKLTPFADGKKRKMKMKKLTAVALCSRGSNQEANVTFFKSADKSKVKKKQPSVLTGIVDGHQHAIEIETWDRKLHLYVTYAKSANDDGGHGHELIIDENDNYSLSVNSGHTHEIDKEQIKAAIMGMLNKTSENTITKEQAYKLQAITTDGDTIKLEDSKMTVELQEKLDKSNKELEAAIAELAIAKSVCELTDTHKSHYLSLADDLKAAFLAKTVEEREAEITVAKSVDAVIYTATDGTVFHKSDDSRFVKLAKEADCYKSDLAKAKSEKETLELTKRASEEFSNLPGSIDAHVALLKSVESIADAAVRTDVENMLKAHNASMNSIFKQVGVVAGVKKADNATAELDRLTKEHVKANPEMNYFDAYEVIAKTNVELYAQAVNS
jgi:hypothetical protein